MDALTVPFQIYRDTPRVLTPQQGPRKLSAWHRAFGGNSPVERAVPPEFAKRSRFVRVAGATGCPQMLVFLKIGSGMLRITAITIRQIGRT
jgi:hypothetical protein